MSYSVKKSILNTEECLAVHRVLCNFPHFASSESFLCSSYGIELHSTRRRNFYIFIQHFSSFYVMEANSQTTSAFCGNTLEMQNCRESPSVLKFLPAENRTGLLCSQRSKAGDEGCCWQWGRHGKGHGPKQGAASPGTSSQLWSCDWESCSVCIVQRIICATQRTACSALWSLVGVLCWCVLEIQ